MVDRVLDDTSNQLETPIDLLKCDDVDARNEHKDYFNDDEFRSEYEKLLSTVQFQCRPELMN